MINLFSFTTEVSQSKSHLLVLEQIEEGFEEIEILEDIPEDYIKNLLVPHDEINDIFEKKQKRSWVWKYFIHITGGLFVCNICDMEVMLTNTNTLYLNNHMMKKHPKVHLYEIRKKKGLLNSKKSKDYEIKNDKELAMYLSSSKKYTTGKKESIYKIIDAGSTPKKTPKTHTCSVDFTKLEAAFVLSRRGNPVIKLGPYIFYKVRRTKNIMKTKVTWRCKNLQKGCRAYVQTVDDRIVHIVGKHNHCICNSYEKIN